MAKKHEHWTKPQHTKTESSFDTGFLAEKLVNTLTDWVVRDFTTIDGMNQYQIDLQRRRCQRLLSIAENIEMIVKDANSLYALYDIDFQERRTRWEKARGYCFELTALLGHIASYTEKDTNIQKYIDLQSSIKTIGAKIKKLIVSDDERRKTKTKEY